MLKTIQENLILVDLNDNQIGVMEKYQAHENPPHLHRASSVWLFNNRGQTLFQKRSNPYGTIKPVNSKCFSL